MADDVAAAVAAGLLAEDAAEAATDPVVEQTAPEASVVTGEPLPDEQEFSFEADTEGIEDLLAEPDDEPELEDDDDPEPVLAQTDEYVDPEVARLQAKLAKAEKQLRYQTDLRAKDNLKGWRAEAERRFPLADVDEIEATSRRAVLRKAQEQHERYNRKLGPVLERLDALKAEVIAEAQQEGRANAEQAYGRPTTAPNIAQVQSAEQELDPRRFKNLHDLTLARLRAGQMPQIADLTE